MDSVVIFEDEWRDDARDRPIPVRVYAAAPTRAASAAPVIVFSHGAGSARDGYEYLGRHWAAQGYVVVHPQHLGSDLNVWRGKAGGAKAALRRSVADPQNAVDRVQDVQFTLARLEELNALGGRFAGQLDLQRLGLAGHSFGAATALAVGGQVVFTPDDTELVVAEPRVRAILAMSAPRPAKASPAALVHAFAAVRAPCLHFTGTRDETPIHETTAHERRIPFDHLHVSDQLLVTFTGGDHLVFAGVKRLFEADEPRDPTFHALIRQATTHFWNAYLRDDPAGRDWLLGSGLATSIGEHGVVEVKKRPNL
jgi:predicted dienelactone hydrolase